VGKPAYTYALTVEAESLFPKAYGIVLHTLLDVLAEQMPEAELDTALRSVGRHLARKQRRPAGELRERVAAAAALVGDLGGLATVEEQPNCLVIAGRSCPLAAAVEGHPETCLLAEALLAEFIGAPVNQVCDPSALRCRFEVPATATPA
jgi:predicted ArsR family transcriptional regulator